MEHTDLVLECVEELENQVEELKPKVCQCVRVEEEINVPEEVKRRHRMCLKQSDPLLYRRPLV